MILKLIKKLDMILYTIAIFLIIAAIVLIIVLPLFYGITNLKLQTKSLEIPFPQPVDEWYQSKYIWGWGIAQRFDIGPQDKPFEYFKNLKFYPENYINYKHESNHTPIIWVSSRRIQEFSDILDQIPYKFVLVTNDEDASFPYDYGLVPPSRIVKCLKIVNHPNVLHIFAQNCDDITSGRVSSIPIGIDFYYKLNMFSPQQQENLMDQVLAQSAETIKRKCRIFVDFQHNNSSKYGCGRSKITGEDRHDIFKKIVATGLVDYSNTRMERHDLWKHKSTYAFSVSPHGNGNDTYRSFEDLVLGCIVIVKTSVLDRLYDNLPVVIVKNWSEITESNLNLWHKKFYDAFSNPEYRYRLTNEYWIQKIKQKAQEYE